MTATIKEYYFKKNALFRTAGNIKLDWLITNTSSNDLMIISYQRELPMRSWKMLLISTKIKARELVHQRVSGFILKLAEIIKGKNSWTERSLRLMKGGNIRGESGWLKLSERFEISLDEAIKFISELFLRTKRWSIYKKIRWSF